MVFKTYHLYHLNNSGERSRTFPYPGETGEKLPKKFDFSPIFWEDTIISKKGAVGS